jgi:putative Holliday junction resolvase
MPESGSSPLGRIAGIDFGTIRIGVAISDANGTIASPLETYVRRDEVQDRRWFHKLVADERVARFVVGLPVHLDGRESAKSTEARAFGRWLAEVTALPVEYFDERFTTHDAQVFLSDARLSKKKRQARLDKLAAQIMLTAYLEKRNLNPDAAEEPLRGLDE